MVHFKIRIDDKDIYRPECADLVFVDDEKQCFVSQRIMQNGIGSVDSLEGVIFLLKKYVREMEAEVEKLKNSQKP